MKHFNNILLIFTAVLILLPSAVSFSHIFSDHHHELCDNYAEHHYHSKAIDCDLHKFHKNPALKIEFPTYELVLEDAGSRLYFNYYDFLNDFEPLPFNLRGPPMFS